jgi:thiol:disulfide interchange protein
MSGDKGAISWNHNLEAALQQARSSNKYVLLDFTAAPM